jgi:hypothetical protein
MKPLVSAIVLSYNRRDETRECLQSIRAQDYGEIELVVLDQGSTDGSAEMVERDFPDARLLRVAGNIGACAGRNRALEEAAGWYVMQVDNDATISPNTARAMVDRLEAEEDLGIIFTRVEDPATGRAYRPGYGTDYVDDEFYTWRFHGCAAMIRRSAIDAAGYYLPEEFFRAAEENDLAVRVLDAGFNILYMPSTVARHKLSPKTRDRGEIVYLTARNNLAVAWKYYPATRAAALTLWRGPHFLATRLGAGDLRGAIRTPGLLAGVAGALRRRRPISRATMKLIDALTVKPALSLAEMRALRENPPAVGFAALAARRMGGAGR